MGNACGAGRLGNKHSLGIVRGAWLCRGGLINILVTRCIKQSHHHHHHHHYHKICFPYLNWGYLKSILPVLLEDINWTYFYLQFEQSTGLFFCLKCAPLLFQKCLFGGELKDHCFQGVNLYFHNLLLLMSLKEMKVVDKTGVQGLWSQQAMHLKGCSCQWQAVQQEGCDFNLRAWISSF
jgi:hypothetical protein